MPAVPPLPDDVRELAAALRRGLVPRLGDSLASIFLYGAIAFPRPERWAIDFDFHVLVHRPLADADRRDIEALHAELAAWELGRDLDGYYVLVSDAEMPEPPRHQLDRSARDEAWALHRAHVHAGRYVVVAGLDPRDLVPDPTWSELEAGLRSELRFIETHPSSTAFGILNGARVLHSFQTRDVVHSKYEAGRWALESLPTEWHDGVRAALRRYERAPAAGDEQMLAEQWAPFVAFVRRSVPVT